MSGPDWASGSPRPPRRELRGRVVNAGCAEGRALVCGAAIGFLGGVDPDTGLVTEPGHPLRGECVTGRVLAFPTGKGSTVGSYTMYRMARAGVAPAAIVNTQADPVVAVGAIIADIPMVDQVDISELRTGDWIRVDGAQVTVTRALRSTEEDNETQR